MATMMLLWCSLSRAVADRRLRVDDAFQRRHNRADCCETRVHRGADRQSVEPLDPTRSEPFGTVCFSFLCVICVCRAAPVSRGYDMRAPSRPDPRTHCMIHDGEPRTVLCVDSDLECREVLTEALAEHQLVFVSDAFGALSQINSG